MAGNIKGINIEIGGDTTKLDRALKEVQNAAKATDKELKDINKSLKFNPGNADLIAQKQRALKTAVQNTKRELTLLKEEQKKAAKAFSEGKISQSQYDAIGRKILATENKLKSLERQLASINNKWKTFGEGMKKVGGKISDVGKKFAPISIAAAGSGLAIVKMSEDFGNAMAKVDTIRDASVPLKDLRKEILATSNELGVASKDIAEGTYMAISSSVETGKAVQFVGEATKLAKAGFTDSASAVDVLTTVINAYGMKAQDATKISDILMQTQNKGKTTVAELASVMGKVIPTAASLKVNVEQLGAAYSIMTARGIRTEIATTTMNAMLNELGKTGSKTDKALREMTGKSFKDLSSSGKNVGEVLQLLKDYANKSGLSLKDMFGSIEAGTAALSLSSVGVEGFNKELDGMKNSTGTTADAYNKLLTPSKKLEKAVNSVKNALIQMGESAAPAIEILAGWIKSLGDAFGKLSPGTKAAILGMIGLLAVFTPIATAVGAVVSAIGGLITFLSGIGGIITTVIGFFTGLTGVFGTVSGAVGTVIAALNPLTLAIGAVIAVGIALIANWKTVVAVAKSVWETIAPVLTPIWNALKEVWTSTWNAIKEFLLSIWNAIKEVATTVWKAVSDVIIAAWKSIEPVATAVWNGIKAVLKTTWDTILALAKTVWKTITNIIQTEWNILKTLVSSVWNGIKAVIKAVWDAIKTIISGAVKAITSLVKGDFNGMKSGIQTIMNGIKDLFKNVWNAIKTTVSNIVKGISSAVKSGLNNMNTTIKSVLANLPSVFRGGFTKALNAVKSMVGQAVNIGKNIIDGMIRGIRNGISGLANAAKTAARNAVNAAKSALGIHSPSKVFADIGLNTMKGFEIGINHSANLPVDALRGAVKSLTDIPESVEINKPNPERAQAININIGEMNVREDSDIDKIAKQLYELLEQQKRGMGAI